MQTNKIRVLVLGAAILSVGACTTPYAEFYKPGLTQEEQLAEAQACGSERDTTRFGAVVQEERDQNWEACMRERGYEITYFTNIAKN